jgi:hypothetical protein
VFGEACVGLGADLWRGLGDVGQPFGEGREVEPGAADDDRARAVDERAEVAEPVADGVDRSPGTWP